MVFSNKRPGLIGLDIGSQTVKAAQLFVQSKGWSSHAMTSFARREPGTAVSVHEAEFIADVLRRRGFVGHRVALSAPDDAAVTALLDLPPENAQVPRERVVRMEIARVHQLAPDAFSCCWSQLPATSAGARTGQVLCWALPHERVHPVLASLEHAGLETLAIEPMSIALQRACKAMLQDPTRISAVVDMGASAVRLVLMHQGCVVHERVLSEWSGRTISQSLSQKWSAPEPLAERAMQRYGVAHDGAVGLLALETAGTITGLFEEMIEQISLSFSFVSHQYPEAELGPLLLTGGVAGMPGLAGLLSEGLELQVVPLTPGVLVADRQAADASADASVVIAVGLAMQEVGRHG